MSSIFKDFFNQGKNNESDAEVEYIGNPPSSSDEVKVTVQIRGQVQGVGFRFSTKEAADEIGVNGIVRNENDGSVYVEAVGTEESIQKFIEILKNGPSPAASVSRVIVEYDESVKVRSNFSQAN